MKKIHFGFKKLFTISLLLIQYSLYSQTPNKPKLNWRIENPLQQNVFIENKNGQFDKQSNEKIYFKTSLNGVDIYFTDKGILYKHNQIIKTPREKGANDPEEVRLKIIPHTAEFSWKSKNTPMQIIPEDEVSFYYSYRAGKRTVMAHAFKKLLCPNLYPGIDVEYSFPQNKNTLSCSIHIHPGANAANAVLVYQGLLTSPENKNANITITNSVGNFTFSMHDAENNYIHSNAQDSELRLSLQSDSVATLWITNPAFNGYNGLYDLCYDNLGNVYVYGGAGPYQLAKINSSGNLEWIYNVNFTYSIGNHFYGDFVTDKTTGTSYLAEALNDSATGPEIIKINSSGILTDSAYIGPLMSEQWRMDLNYCTNQILIGGGGVYAHSQFATIDTSLSGGTSFFNILGATDGKHDIAILTADKKLPACYMASAVSNDLMTSFDNVLLKCPLPTFTASPYMNYDQHAFVELESNRYVDFAQTNPLEMATNGVNGIVATDSILYIWDGALMSSYNKNSGNIISSKWINPSVRGYYNQELITCGGIDADYCGNIYIGNGSAINVLDTGFNVTNTITLPASSDTIYDLHISPQGFLYACGYGFVSSYSIPQSASTLIKTTSPACSGCNGIAFVSLSGCNIKAQFSWSNGATGQYATNLCAGTYTVSARLDCSTVLTDTVIISPSPNPSVAIPAVDVKQASCFNANNGSAVAVASNGTSPYTYQWYPSGTSSDTLTNLSPGTYTIIATDTHGCASIDTVTITQPPALNVSASGSGAIQQGQNATLTALPSGGTMPYTYLWSDNSTTSEINVNPTNTTTYTLTLTDYNGCTSTTSVVVDVLCGTVFVPDAFSPNDDGHNDYLLVRGDCIADMTFNVFDRWGNRVFTSNSINIGWDGTYKGQPMNPGTYVWYLNATLKDGTTLQKKGNVTLVR